LDVRLGRQIVEIYAGATLVTSHARVERGRVTRVEHHPPAGQAFLRGTPKRCLEQAEALGRAVGIVASALLTPYSLTHLREVQALLRLGERYAAEDWGAAGGRSLESITNAITDTDPSGRQPPECISNCFEAP